MWLPILVTVLAGYLLGNINGAVSMSTLLSHQDIREHGSGNAGLTNFVRTFGAARAVLVFVIDMTKTIMACLIGKLVLEPYGYGFEGLMLGAVAVSMGHDFPVLLGFRGGKGILCGLAVAVVADWRIALIILAVFGVTVLITRYVSVGSMLACAAFAVSFCVLHHDHVWVAVASVFIGAFGIFMHRTNLVRLFKGTENKVGSKKKDA